MRLRRLLRYFALYPYPSSVRQHQALWYLLIRHKPTTDTIDASNDVSFGATYGAARMALPATRARSARGKSRFGHSAPCPGALWQVAVGRLWHPAAALIGLPIALEINSRVANVSQPRKAPFVVNLSTAATRPG